MSWSKFTCFFAFCALLAAPVMADPSLSVELATGSTAAVGANGGFQWVIGVNPDETLFADFPDDPDQGVGGSTAIDVGLTLDEGAGAVASTLDANSEYENVGLSVFGDETVGWDGVEIGSDDSNVAVALGSTFFTGDNSADLDVVYTLATVETGPINTDNLTTTISWTGMYDANGDEGGSGFGAIAQYDASDVLGSQYGVSGSATYTALAGDANLDGAVDLLDLDILGANWNGTAMWGGANFNNQSDSVTDLLDLDILGAGWGNTLPAAIGAVSVPEPSSVAALALLLVGAAGSLKFRRS